MRRCLIVLAVCGMLAGPYLSAADDPFDFSSPLEDKSTRTSQASSRLTTEKDSDWTKSTSPSDQSAFRRAKRLTSAELLGEKSPVTEKAAKTPVPTIDRPESVSFGQEMVRERAAASRRDPQDALQRFDEFLKSRDVVSAEYTAPSDRAEESSIQQVQSSDNQPSPFEDDDDLPEFGNLDGAPPSSLKPTARQETEMLLFGNQPSPGNTPDKSASRRPTGIA